MNENNDDTNDLDRFINGEICYEEIQGYIHEDIPIDNAILFAKSNKAFYNDKEHDLYEKICYADVLRSCHQFIKDNLHEPVYIYTYYLYLKDISASHKLDWDNLLEKIKKEMIIDKWDMDSGGSYYKTYHEAGSWSDDDYDFD